MKKITILTLILALLMTAFTFNVNAAWDGDASVQFGGEGTAENPYVIATVENLKYLQEEVLSGESFAGKYFVQTADIDLCGKEWLPIGNSTMPFSGVYNGQGFKISGLYISTSATFIGLFGYVCSTANDEAGIANLNLSGRIELLSLTADAGIGSLVGWAYKDAEDGFKPVKFSNITSNVDFLISETAKQPRFGGIFGYCFNAEVTDAVYEGVIDYTGSAHSRIGGISGQSNRTTYTNCVNNGTITCKLSGAAGANIGGMIGMTTYKNATPTVLTNCINNGDIKATSQSGKIYAGGMLGGVYSSGSSYNIQLDSCLNTGSIYGQVEDSNVTEVYPYVGGIAAYAAKSGLAVEKCVNTGDITSTGGSGERGGGIVGAFSLSGDDTVYLSNCQTSGNLAGYISCPKDGCTENVDTLTITAAANLIKDAVTESTVKINGFPTEAGAEAVTPETKPVEETTTSTPVETTKPEEETTKAVETTTANETTTADVTTKTPETSAPEKTSGGCGSATVGITALVILVGAVAVVAKKKED